MDSMIPTGQKNTLAEYMILSCADNRLPMLDKDMYDLWKRIMELYMQNREHKRIILESVEHGPLIYHTIEENRVTRTKKYAELSPTEKIQANCDMKAINIILQGLPTDIYSLVNHHKISKDLWEKVQLLMQVNTKFLNNLPPQWSKFVTDVKLVKDLHTTNFDQLYAYLEQYELYANEVRTDISKITRIKRASANTRTEECTKARSNDQALIKLQSSKAKEIQIFSKSWGFIKLREKLGNSKTPKDYGRDKSVKSKPSLTQDQAHATSVIEKAQIHMGFYAKTLTKEAQWHPKGNDTLAIFRCPHNDQTATIEAPMIRRFDGHD
ncbi:hypothetical protein Tco_1307307 [Tanacetum coccineum]